MRVSLVLLAFGTLTTWLLAGGLSRMLAGTLPFHQIETEGTLEMVSKIFLAPPTWIALGVIALGFGLWIAARSAGESGPRRSSRWLPRGWDLNGSTSRSST